MISHGCCVMCVQDSDDYSVRQSPATAAPHKTQTHDAESSGQSDTEDPSQEMSDVLKKDPIISKYSKYRVTKRTAQQKSSCKYSVVWAHESSLLVPPSRLHFCLG